MGFDQQADDTVDASVGGSSGRSVGVGLRVDPTPDDDELEGVEEVFEARPFAQLAGAGAALVAGGAGLACLAAPFFGEHLAWPAAGVVLLGWATFVFRKALRVRPDRILVYGDRVVIVRRGQRAVYPWSTISHATHFTHSRRNRRTGQRTETYCELLLVPTSPHPDETRIPLADDRRYEQFGRVLEVIQRHCDLRFEGHTPLDDLLPEDSPTPRQ